MCLYSVQNVFKVQTPLKKVGRLVGEPEREHLNFYSKLFTDLKRLSF